MLWMAVVITVVAGLANPFQTGTNAELNKQLGQPLLAGMWVYVSGLAGLVLIALMRRHFSFVGLVRPVWAVQQVPWWAWLGGAISIVSTLAGLTQAQKLGSATFTGLTITASLVASVALDHFGWIGFRQHAASPARLAGCALLIGGVWLVTRS